MGGFLGGALSGFADEASKRQSSGKSGLLSKLRKKKQLPLTPSDSSNTTNLSQVPSYKRGGKVKKTGLAYVHKGEKVIPAKRKRGRSAGKRR
jgi:hypothetical protein